jgi:DNA processing protein
VDIDLLKNLEKKYEGKYISILDDNYPAGLKEISRAPFILYYEGNIDLLYTNKGI